MRTILLLIIITFFSSVYLIAQTLAVNGMAYAESNSAIVAKTRQNVRLKPLFVYKCSDFAVNGKGDNAGWIKAGWNSLAKLDTGGRSYESRFKILYSPTGLYLLFHGEDDKITTKDYKDFEAIYNGDVFEAFFLPDRTAPVYFEYEINQLSRELQGWWAYRCCQV